MVLTAQGDRIEGWWQWRGWASAEQPGVVAWVKTIFGIGSVAVKVSFDT
jgi:hypothetical protein